MRRVAAAGPARGKIVRRCGEPRARLVYDSGRFRHGPAQDVLTQDHLEALHGCPLAPAAPSAAPAPVPVR